MQLRCRAPITGAHRRYSLQRHSAAIVKADNASEQLHRQRLKLVDRPALDDDAILACNRSQKRVYLARKQRMSQVLKASLNILHIALITITNGVEQGGAESLPRVR